MRHRRQDRPGPDRPGRPLDRDAGPSSAELARLSSGDIDGVAHDLGVSQADLRDVLPRGTDNTKLMEAMLRAHGLDTDQVAHLSPTVVRDLELTCTRCGAAKRCGRELAAGTANDHCHEFCGNADTFDALLDHRREA